MALEIGVLNNMAAQKASDVIITKTDHPLRILCFGAGAIGTYIGGSLALAGHEVVFLERPAMSVRLKNDGLKLWLGEKKYQVISPQIIESLDEVVDDQQISCDVGIVAVKAFDTAEFALTLQPYLKYLPPLLSLQNGVDNETILGHVVGSHRVIPGTVTSAIGRLGAGEIVLERLRGVGVTAGYPISNRLVDAMNEAGLKAHLYANGGNLKWSKMLTNLLANATSAILDMTPGEIYAHCGLVRLELEQINEALQVMQRMGLKPVNLPGTPLKSLVWGIRWLPTPILAPLLKKAIGGGRGGKMPSFHIDLYQGRGGSEVGYLNGAVAKHGEAMGIATPVNKSLTAILLALTNGEIPLDAFRHNPDKLLAAVYSKSAKNA